MTARELGYQEGHVSVSIEDITQEDWKKEALEQIKSEDMIIELNF